MMLGIETKYDYVRALEENCRGNHSSIQKKKQKDKTKMVEDRSDPSEK